MLYVNGPVDDEIASPLAEVEGDLPTLAALQVVFNSPGGTFLAGELLERLILQAKAVMPVGAFVRDARSTVVIPAVAAHATRGDSGAITGGFGMMIHTCDGHKPMVVVNSQSPRKYDGGPMLWPPRKFLKSHTELQRLQTLADRQYETDLELVSRYSGTPPDRLRPYLDGRPLLAEEAVEAGLLQGICDEDTAYSELLLMAERSKTEKEK
ncbi:MAG: hypothetical protein ACOWWM_16270 [Desulfobacterales bacterium]